MEGNKPQSHKNSLGIKGLGQRTTSQLHKKTPRNNPRGLAFRGLHPVREHRDSVAKTPYRTAVLLQGLFLFKPTPWNCQLFNFVNTARRNTEWLTNLHVFWVRFATITETETWRENIPGFLFCRFVQDEADIDTIRRWQLTFYVFVIIPGSLISRRRGIKPFDVNEFHLSCPKI